MICSRKEAWNFVRQLAREINKNLSEHQDKINRKKRSKRKKWRLRVYHPPETVKYKHHESDPDSEWHVYTQFRDGEAIGRIKIGYGTNMKIQILKSWNIPREELHKDLHLMPKIKTTKSENRWKGIKS